MAYTKQTWQTGDTITATKLNHIEDGISEAGNSNSNTLIVEKTYHSGTQGESYFSLNKTWQEIYNALVDKKSVIVWSTDEGYVSNEFVVEALVDDTGSNEKYIIATRNSSYEASSYDEYPKLDNSIH